VVFACQDIADQRMLELDLKLTRSINLAVMRGDAPGKRLVELRVIGPSVPLRIGAMKFNDQVAMDRAFDIGLSEGRMALAAALYATGATRACGSPRRPCSRRPCATRRPS
jgi:hypothetical protein